MFCVAVVQTCCSWSASPPPSVWCRRSLRRWRGGGELRRLHLLTASMRYDPLLLLSQPKDSDVEGRRRGERWRWWCSDLITDDAKYFRLYGLWDFPVRSSDSWRNSGLGLEDAPGGGGTSWWTGLLLNWENKVSAGRSDLDSASLLLNLVASTPFSSCPIHTRPCCRFPTIALGKPPRTECTALPWTGTLFRNYCKIILWRITV